MDLIKNLSIKCKYSPIFKQNRFLSCIFRKLNFLPCKSLNKTLFDYLTMQKPIDENALVNEEQIRMRIDSLLCS